MKTGMEWELDPRHGRPDLSCECLGDDVRGHSLNCPRHVLLSKDAAAFQKPIMDMTLNEMQAGLNKARTFESGATRDTDEGKLDYEGFLHPAVLERYAEYMHENRVQSDGALRDADNWQKGIPRDQYMKSAWRHFHEWWRLHRGGYFDPGSTGIDEGENALCALLFNVMGYLYEVQQRR